MVFSKHLYMVILSYILLIIAVAGAGIALIISHTALILILALNLFNCFTKALIKKSEIIKKRQPRIRAVCVIISAIPAPATAIINKM